MPEPTAAPGPLTAEETAEGIFHRLADLYDQELKHLNEYRIVLKLYQDNAAQDGGQPEQIGDWFLWDYVLGSFDHSMAYARMLKLYGVNGDDYESVTAALQQLYGYYLTAGDPLTAYLAIEKLIYRNSRLPEEWENIRASLAELQENHPDYARLADLQEFCETAGQLLTAEGSDQDPERIAAALEEFRDKKKALTAKWSEAFLWEGSAEISHAPLRDAAAQTVLGNAP